MNGGYTTLTFLQNAAKNRDTCNKVIFGNRGLVVNSLPCSNGGRGHKKSRDGGRVQTYIHAYGDSDVIGTVFLLLKSLLNSVNSG